MNRIYISLRDIPTTRLQLGFEGENDHTQVIFDGTLLYARYPSAVASMTVKSPSGGLYPKTLVQSGNKLVWNITASDCAKFGSGQYQLTFTSGTEVIKTYIGNFSVNASLLGSGDPPDPVEDWLQEAQEALDAFEQDVSDAEAWAVGTRDGDPVGSTDPTYHNNSKYYADQAGSIEQTIESTGAAQVAAIEAKGEEVLESIPSDYTALSEDVDELYAIKAPAIECSASGSIASFADGADGMPLRSLSVAIEPVQDLHGQDAPYPPGGGKNLLPPPVDGTYEGNGVKAVVSNGVITLSGTTTSSGNALIIPLSKPVDVPVGAYIHLLNSVANGSLSLSFENSSTPGTLFVGAPTATPANRIMQTSNASVVTIDRIRSYLANGVTLSGTLSPMICMDDTARSFAPYSNICPISGWDSANVGVAEHYASIRPDAVTPYTDHGVTYNADKYPFIKVNGTATGGTAYSGTIGSTNASFRLPAGTHTLKIIGDIDNVEAVIQFETGSGLSNVALTKSNLSETFTLSAECGIAWYLKTNNGQTTDSMFAIVYEEGQAYEYPFPQSAGTVYGGTLTIHQDGSGELVVDAAINVFDGSSDESISPYPTRNGFVFYGLSGMASGPFVGGYCNQSNVTDGELTNFAMRYTDNSGYWLYAQDKFGITDVADLRTYLGQNPLQLCYKLTTPVTYTLSALEVIETLKGNNVLWADTGDVAVSYPADTRLFIEKKISELQALILENISNS